MNERVLPTNPEHEVLYNELANLLERFKELPKEEVLAVAANMVGKIIALQDQRTMTPERAMAIVERNIEIGNRQIFELMQQDVTGRIN